MVEVTDEFLATVAERLKAMASPIRLRIIHTLHDGELPVAAILDKVGSSQANVSKHLNVLRTAGLVSSRRAGSNVYYKICDEGVFAICDVLCDSLLAKADADVGTIARGRAAMRAGRGA